MKASGLKSFRSPGNEFRGAPLWAWNSKLEIPELLRQIRELKKMGFGGFFMHSRVGLNTVYLSNEWFDCVRACVQEAEKLGINAWLYDEDRWPSGFAGSLVTQDDRFKMKGLYCEEITDVFTTSGEGNTLAYFLVDADFAARRISGYRRITEKELYNLSADQKVLRFYWQYDKRCSWFNGETYIDTLNKDAVRKFIEVTHEQYRREIGGAFGKTVPGIFSDEPCYSHFTVKALPWSADIPEEFKKKYGRDLLEHLPELFYHTVEKVNFYRWAFFNLITELFVDAFAGTIGRWCNKNNMKMTGHVLTEDSLIAQTACSGAVMRFYEHMQMPGIDLLTEHWDIWVTVKQCISAARQFGKKNRLTEIYGCTGWDFPFYGHKALGDFLYALGINFRCPHLAWYSMGGESKRDYPASISYQVPWAEKYPVVEDYFARIGSVLTGGSEIRDLLVIHPVESFWSTTLRHPELIPEKRPEMDLEFEWLTKELLAENLDFDYGDEDIIARFGSTENGSLHIGKASYRIVLIPELTTIRSTTLKLLEKSAADGVEVCYFGDAPEYVDALNSTEAATVFNRYFIKVDKSDFTAKLELRARRVSLRAGNGGEIRPLLFHLAQKDDFYSLFICNFGKEFSENMMMEDYVCNRTMTFPETTVKVKVPENGTVYEFDPETGNIYVVKSVYQEGWYCFDTSFAKLGSRLFVISKNIPQKEVLPPRQEPVLQKIAELPSRNLGYSLDEPNVLVLDHADYLVNGQWRGSGEYILCIDDKLRKELGSELRGVAMAQPWKRQLEPPKDVKTLDLILRYEFYCDVVPAECFLVLENPELYTITVNGRTLTAAADSWYVDHALRKMPLASGFLISGRNIIELTGIYSAEQSGVEAVYLLGNFGVKNNRITALPSLIDLGDWCKFGFPHYSGNLTYHFKLDSLEKGRVFLSFPSWRGCLLGIKVNNGVEKYLAWPPERVEIGDELKRNGEDELSVTVYGHRKNVFGPFYLNDRRPVWTGNIQFKTCEVEEKQFVSVGLLSPPFLETEVKLRC
ncbi:MAG: hypothetical protein E7053_01535 [Lentisphaerae bacterium]|nr:hypothetical protein [Lentisphaerota bacterium]